MSVSLRPLHPLFVAEVAGVDAAARSCPRPSRRSTPRSTATRYWCCATRISTTTASWPLPDGLARSRRRAAPSPASSAGCARKSPTSPTSTKTIGGAPPTTRAGSTSSATGCGIPTGRFAACPPPCRCSTRIGCRRAGGETEFADLRAAYDALPDKTQAEIGGLVAMHDIAYSRAQIGFTELLFGEHDVLPAVPQRVVRRHPGSGRQTLYLASHACAYRRHAGAGGAAAVARPDRVRDRAPLCLPPLWREGDLVIWDNRCTMHRGRPFDESETRDLRRATTRDMASTLDQVA